MSEERKLVTILFADVTGFTELGEMLDPEDVRALMGRYYTHAREIVSNHGGTLEKFIGDAIMAVFGLPHAHGDDAERALAAALALRGAVANDALLDGRLLLRMGINTGEVIATSEPTASDDFLVTGDVVNVAARLQQAANAGEIIAGERTATAAQAAFLFGEARYIEVKGKSQSLTVYPLVEARAMREVGRPPLVGRKSDLLQLELLRARVLEEQRPQLVSILAPAGTGKTRLLEEFLARLDPSDGFKIATARCLPYGQTLTYWPLRGLLSELLGDEIGKPQIVDAFVRGGHTTEDAGRLADQVLATLGIDCDEAMDRESIFITWRLLIEACGRSAPQIIVFEDLHWASDSLLDLVEHIMHPRTQVPLLIIGISRPELLDRRPTWGGGRQSFTALALQPLNEGQTRELIESLTPGMHQAIRERIIERSGGNPFFAIEMVRGMAERGMAGQAVMLNQLPDTVHAAVLARLDLLSTQEREVVQVAAVAGRTFRPATLQTVLNLELETIDAAIDRLVARNLVAPADGDAFTFRHVLIRDVAYGTLSRTERVRIHGKVAAWLEEYAAGRLDEFAELIAYHYREAVLLARQSSVLLELPIDPSHAVYYLARAGVLASRSGAFVEARNYLQSAIDIAPESERGRLYEELGDCLVHGDTVADAYRKALQHWRDGGAEDALVGVRLLRKLLMVYIRWIVTTRPSREELDRLQAEAERLAEQAGDEDECYRVRLINLFCWPDDDITNEEVTGRRETALAAAAHFEAKGDWIAFSEALDGYTALSQAIGAYEDALDALNRRLAAPELSPFERGDALNMIAKTHFSRGDYDHCIATMHEALAQLRPGEPLGHLCTTLSWAMIAALLSGRWSDLSDLSITLEEMWQQVQYDPGVAMSAHEGYMALLYMAMAHEDCAVADNAASVLHRIYPKTKAFEHSLIDAYRADDLGKLDLNLSGVAKLFIPALLFLNENGAQAPAALLEGANLYRHANDSTMPIIEISKALVAEDLVRLRTAIDNAEAQGLIPHAARMRVVLASHTGDSSQLERARSVLERLGDRQFLRRLEEVEMGLGEGMGKR